MQRSKFKMAYDHYVEKLQAMRQTEKGAEVPDPVPMAPPIGYVKQPSMVEHIRNMIRSEKLREEAEAAGAETFEEADDFDVEDEYEPTSNYEFEPFFDPPAPPPISKPAKEGGAEGAEAGAPKETAPAPAPAPSTVQP